MLRHFISKRFNYLNMFQVISIFSSLPLSPSFSLSNIIIWAVLKEILKWITHIRRVLVKLQFKQIVTNMEELVKKEKREKVCGRSDPWSKNYQLYRDKENMNSLLGGWKIAKKSALSIKELQAFLSYISDRGLNMSLLKVKNY